MNWLNFIAFRFSSPTYVDKSQKIHARKNRERTSHHHLQKNNIHYPSNICHAKRPHLFHKKKSSLVHALSGWASLMSFTNNPLNNFLKISPPLVKSIHPKKGSKQVSINTQTKIQVSHVKAWKYFQLINLYEAKKYVTHMKIVLNYLLLVFSCISSSHTSLYVCILKYLNNVQLESKKRVFRPVEFCTLSMPWWCRVAREKFLLYNNWLFISRRFFASFVYDTSGLSKVDVYELSLKWENKWKIEQFFEF